MFINSIKYNAAVFILTVVLLALPLNQGFALSLDSLLVNIVSLDENISNQAVTELNSLDDKAKEQIVLQLLPYLKKHDSFARKQVIIALGQLGPLASEALPSLIEVLNDQDGDIRWRAMFAIGMIGPAAYNAVPALIAKLDDGNTRDQMEAAGALGGIGPAAKSAVPALIKKIQESNFRVQTFSVNALGGIGPDASSAIPVLIGLLKNNKALSLQQSAANSLSKIGNLAMPELIKALQDTSSRIRAMAASALGKIKLPTADVIASLEHALEDSNFEVLSQASIALGTISKENIAARTVLLKALDNATPHIRYEAAINMALEMPPEVKAIPILVDALGNEKYPHQYLAISRISVFGVKARKAVIPLKRVFKYANDVYIKLSAACSIIMIDPTDETIVNYLIMVLKQGIDDGEPDDTARPEAAKALQKVKTKKAIEALKKYKSQK